MFDGIKFTHKETQRPIVSRSISPEVYKEDKYSSENLANSEFYIYGGIDAFLRPEITDYAKQKLYYMQAFDIFSYGKGSFTRRKNFSSYLIIYTYSGKGKLCYGDKEYTLCAEDGAFIDCRKPHYYEAVDDWKVAILHFTGAESDYMCSEFEKNGPVVFHESVSGRFHRYIEHLLSVYDSPSLYRDLRVSHCIESLLIYLLILNSDISVSKNDIPNSVQTAMKYIEDNFEKYISLDDLSTLTNVNKFHLSKEFKKYTGFSPHEYLIHLRINHAKILLKTTELPAVKIAHLVGIHDVNNFYYLFNKKVGMTPIKYRHSGEVIL